MKNRKITDNRLVKWLLNYALLALCFMAPSWFNDTPTPLDSRPLSLVIIVRGVMLLMCALIFYGLHMAFRFTYKFIRERFSDAKQKHSQ